MEAFRRHPGAESSNLRRGLHLRVAAMLRRQESLQPGARGAPSHEEHGELPTLEECERMLAEERGETMTTMMDAQFDRWRAKSVARG